MLILFNLESTQKKENRSQISRTIPYRLDLCLPLGWSEHFVPVCTTRIVFIAQILVNYIFVCYQWWSRINFPGLLSSVSQYICVQGSTQIEWGQYSYEGKHRSAHTGSVWIWLIKLLHFFFFDYLFSPRSDKKKYENSEWKRQRGVRGCLYCSTHNSLCISFSFGSRLSQVFFSIAGFHSLSLSLSLLSVISTPLCLSLLSSLSSVICAPPEIRGFSTLATLVWGSSKTFLAAHLIQHLIFLVCFHHTVAISPPSLPTLCVRNPTQWLRIAFNSRVTRFRIIYFIKFDTPYQRFYSGKDSFLFIFLPNRLECGPSFLFQCSASEEVGIEKETL